MRNKHLLRGGYLAGLICIIALCSCKGMTSSVSAAEAISYDMETGEETRIQIGNETKTNETDWAADPGYPDQGSAGADVLNGFSLNKLFQALRTDIVGEDGRIPLNYEQRTTFPYSAVVYVSYRMPNGQWYHGTGAMIGPRTVLTAAHCLYKAAYGGWAETMEVIPAMDHDSHPYGSDYACNLTVLPGFMSEASGSSDYTWEMNKYDIGIITLSSPLGDSTGWFGIGTCSAADENVWMYSAGYPGDKEALYVISERMNTESWTNALFVSSMDVEGGQSGSPVFTPDLYIKAVHVSSGDDTAHAVKITDEVYSWICSCM